jgi:3-hydroxybutyryl-CoA dehydratase
MNGYKSFEEIAIGDKVSYAKTMTEAETYIGVGLIGALNPVHIDEEYCKKTRFKKRIGVALMVYALSVNTAENFLVGPGSTLVAMDGKFTAPVYYGDTIKTEVEVINVDAAAQTVSFNHVMTNQDGNTVMLGEFCLKVAEVQ